MLCWLDSSLQLPDNLACSKECRMVVESSLIEKEKYLV